MVLLARNTAHLSYSLSLSTINRGKSGSWLSERRHLNEQRLSQEMFFPAMKRGITTLQEGQLNHFFFLFFSSFL